MLLGPAGLIAILAGWITTEMGRQPWVVYGVMRTDAAVTGASSIPVGYGLLAAVYAVLIAATLWALRRLAKIPMPPAGPERRTVHPTEGSGGPGDPGQPATAH